MGHIFISYSHKDSSYVHKLVAALEEEGFEVWIDDRIHYGSEWPRVVTRNLDVSDGVIVVLSNNSYESDMVQNEVTRAREKKKPIFPLLLEGDNWLIVQAKQFVDVRDESIPTEKFYKRLEETTQRKNEKAERQAAEKAEKEAAEKERVEAEWQARRKAAKEKAAREKAERDAAEKVAREKKDRETAEKPKPKIVKSKLAEERLVNKTAQAVPKETEIKSSQSNSGNQVVFWVVGFIAVIFIIGVLASNSGNTPQTFVATSTPTKTSPLNITSESKNLSLNGLPVILSSNIDLIEKLTQRIIPTNDSFSDVIFSYDGLLLATVDYGDNAYLLNSNDLESTSKLKVDNPDVTYFGREKVIFLPDNRSVLVGPDSMANNENLVRLWSVDGALLRTFPSNFYSGVALSSDGKILATGFFDTNTVKLWQIDNGQLIKVLAGADTYVFSLAFSPDGRFLVSGSDDKKVHIWQIDTGIQIGTLEGHNDSVMEVAFSPDGKILASASIDGFIRLWNFEERTTQHVLETKGWVRSIAFSPDGKLLVTCSSDDGVYIWQVNDGSLLKKIDGDAMSAAFSPDGSLLVFGSTDEILQVWGIRP